jgi:TolB-like protein/Flp pilus assembly protein TadD
VSPFAGAVFLSYASEDSEAAARISDALKAAGIEVWFDRSELRGGDAWDRQIRKQIHDCRLFIAVISAHTETRDEGYFRREWRLAVERAGDMAEDKAFVVPVAIDGTSERSARVPDPFKGVQWIRLRDGDTPPAFVERVRRLLSADASPTAAAPANSASGALASTRERVPASWWSAHSLMVIVAVVVAVAVGYLALAWTPRPAALPPTVAAAAAPAAFSPPPHSIAVLPFVNMSGDKDQEYFSDGLSEELLNDLSRINELQVAARTSAFSFKGKDVDIGTIARKLNVSAVLEGSVRRSAHTVRVSAQLINGVTGFHIWSDAYDSDLGDALKLQTEIATAVAAALKVTLLPDHGMNIEVGGTRNAAALDAYLRASRAYWGLSANQMQVAIDGYTEAIRLDPEYALAYSARAYALLSKEGDYRAEAENDARRAIALAPELGQAHLALAMTFESLLDFGRANQKYEQAMTLSAGNERVLRHFGLFAVLMGQTESGLAAARRAVAVDPINYNAHGYLGGTLHFSHHYKEAIAALERAIQLAPSTPVPLSAFIGKSYYALGEYEKARVSCEAKADSEEGQWCLALVYNKLGRKANAESELTRLEAAHAQESAYEYATIYAQWGNFLKALEWLDTAMRLRDPGLERLKVDPLLDPLRNEGRFHAIEKALKFPESVASLK